MEKGKTSVTNKMERKTLEKNRREQMKDLCFKLVSLIPTQHNSNKPKRFMSQQNQLGEAVAYIKNLEERIEELKRKKVQILLNKHATNECTKKAAAVNLGESNLPILEIKELGSNLEVVLISGLNKYFMLHQIISIVEEEGGEVTSANISTIGDKIFHTLHAQAKISRVGVDTSRTYERIHELVSL